jgi:hypothetical protein
MMPVWKPVYKPVYKAMPAVVTPAVVTPTAAVATKGAAAASGASQASVSTQTIIQTNTQSVTGNNNTVTFGGLSDGGSTSGAPLQTGQSNTASNSNVVIKNLDVNAAVAWNNSTAKAVSEVE